MIHFVFIFGLIWKIFGEYPPSDSVIRISWTSSDMTPVDGTIFVELLPRFIRVYPLEILNTASRSTRTPVNLKNHFANVPERYEVSPPTPSNPGAVPRAKAIIMRAPVVKLPVVIA